MGFYHEIQVRVFHRNFEIDDVPIEALDLSSSVEISEAVKLFCNLASIFRRRGYKARRRYSTSHL